ncbi:hypothetical protein M3J09_010426 [Ascochyta lentis]
MSSEQEARWSQIYEAQVSACLARSRIIMSWQGACTTLHVSQCLDRPSCRAQEEFRFALAFLLFSRSLTFLISTMTCIALFYPIHSLRTQVHIFRMSHSMHLCGSHVYIDVPLLDLLLLLLLATPKNDATTQDNRKK